MNPEPKLLNRSTARISLLFEPDYAPLQWRLCSRNRDGLFCFDIQGTREECIAHIARNQFRDELRMIPI